MSYWTPTLGRVYGLRPSDMPDLRPSHLDAIRADLRALEEASRA